MKRNKTTSKVNDNDPLVSGAEWQKLTTLYEEHPFWALARALHFSALEGMHAFRETLAEEFNKDNEIVSQMMAGIYREYLILFLHLLTRLADEEVGSENVSQIQQALISDIAKNAQAYYEGDVSSVARMLVQTANERERFYARAKYWVAPNDGNGRWINDLNSTEAQFFVHLADIFGWDLNDPVKQITLISDATAGLTTYFYLFSLKEWLKGPIIVLGLKNYENIDLAPPKNEPIEA